MLTSGTGAAKRALAVATLAAMLGIPCAAHAQTEAERIQDLERKLERSLRVIDNLERRVRELEKTNAAATTAAAAPAPPAPGAPMPHAQEERIKALETSVAQMSTGRDSASAAISGIPLHGFADVEYHYTNLDRPDNRRSGFALGNLDFFMTPEFGRVKTLAELNFEIESDTGEVATDLERLQIGYTFSDSFTGWAGRFHTPYGYWNAAFHHGIQIQTSATRPRFVDFEDKGGILPAHTVGLWGVGHVNTGNGSRVVYDAWLANGSRIVDGVLDFNAYRDDNRNSAVGGNLGYRFGGALEGLLVGVHGLREEVDVYGGGEQLARTRLAFGGGYFYLDRDNWEAIGEYYRFRNADLSGGTGTHSSWAAFAQLGYTFRDLWTPYYRWEKANLDQTDAYFAAQESGRSYTRNVLGLRFLVNPSTSMQVEGNRTREILGEEKSYSELRAVLAIRF